MTIKHNIMIPIYLQKITHVHLVYIIYFHKKI